MSFTYSTKELQNLEQMLEKKLFDLKVAQQGAKTPPGEFDELSLTTNILKFVQYLVNRELSELGHWRKNPLSPLSDPPYTYGYGSVTSTGGAVMPNVSSVSDTSTICENCRQLNPTHTHCVHKVVSADFDAHDLGDCDFGSTIGQIKAIKVEK
jgi:hypothetical protein